MKLGCAIYPEYHDYSTIENYLTKLKKFGFKRIFISLLQINDTETFIKYQKILGFLKNEDFQVVADVNPDVLNRLGWSEDLIGKLNNYGINIIRLDEAPSLKYLAELTHNNHEVKIELNMSTHPEILRELIEMGADKNNITGSHNFYPKRYTGLSEKHFKAMTKFFRDYGVETSAFVNSPCSNEGPWPLAEGLCTLEDHRYKNLNYQINYFKALGNIDNVIVANQFMSEEEMKLLSDAVEKPVTFQAQLKNDISTIEREIVESMHVYRGDISHYVIRSSNSRVKYGNSDIKPIKQSKKVHKGDIMIDNNLYKRYKGELQIALTPFEVSDKTNIVGQIDSDYIPLLENLKPWANFKFDMENDIK
ncbi:MupG family TIM beta-alpha barrel fold protein [Aerococcus urinae]|uniref:DUF871 domain-containing protein n=1 Tax=Aerococcus urinae TaxID=1376 RepID=UPI0025501889|nr:MupG family TIM beta-alpha barrel fold protein [Aerococcus urinae]MDK6371125.1 MupG family TIM beta-alpha barrel fold protein [Aerococcus urinae]